MGLSLCAETEVDLVLLLVMLSRSTAGKPLLHGSNPAMRQCQVGCIAYTSQHPLRERSTVLF